MREFKYIIVHHSASDFGNANIIDNWHKERGFDEIGYHFVIQNGFPNNDDFIHNRRWGTLNGQIEVGRTLDKDDDFEINEVGSHALSFNSNSIGICLIHLVKPYTEKQKESLMELLYELVTTFSIDVQNIRGHSEIDYKKPHCPSLDMSEIRWDLQEKLNPK